jgi:hypothetical protein
MGKIVAVDGKHIGMNCFPQLTAKQPQWNRVRPGICLTPSPFPPLQYCASLPPPATSNHWPPWAPAHLPPAASDWPTARLRDPPWIDPTIAALASQSAAPPHALSAARQPRRRCTNDEEGRLQTHNHRRSACSRADLHIKRRTSARCHSPRDQHFSKPIDGWPVFREWKPPAKRPSFRRDPSDPCFQLLRVSTLVLSRTYPPAASQSPREVFTVLCMDCLVHFVCLVCRFCRPPAPETLLMRFPIRLPGNGATCQVFYNLSSNLHPTTCHLHALP